MPTRKSRPFLRKRRPSVRTRRKPRHIRKSMRKSSWLTILIWRTCWNDPWLTSYLTSSQRKFCWECGNDTEAEKSAVKRKAGLNTEGAEKRKTRTLKNGGCGSRLKDLLFPRLADKRGCVVHQLCIVPSSLRFTGRYARW